MFLLGTCALMDAVSAAGRGRLAHRDSRRVAARAGRRRPGLDGHVAADALIGAFARHHRCEQPIDAELLERIGRVEGDALVNLVRVGAVPYADVLPVGLMLLSAFAHLCRSDSASLLQRTA